MSPLADYVFIRHEKKESDKKGIIFSDVTRNKTEVGVVEAVGPDCPKELKKGKRVAFNPFVPRSIKVDGRDFLVIRSKEVYATLK